MIRAVIDTNVLVSGLIAPAGNEALILLAIHQGMLRPCFSADILEEYAEVLARPKFAFPPDEIDALRAMFRSVGELIKPEGPPPVLPDPDDAKFLHCAAEPPRRNTSSPATSGIFRCRATGSPWS